MNEKMPPPIAVLVHQGRIEDDAEEYEEDIEVIYDPIRNVYTDSYGTVYEITS